MLPVQRKSRSQTRMGRSHHALQPPHTTTCPNCGSPRKPHAACGECGYVRPGLKLNLDQED